MTSGLISLVAMLAACAPTFVTFAYADRRIGGDDPRPKSHGYGAVLLLTVMALALGWGLKVSDLVNLGLDLCRLGGLALAGLEGRRLDAPVTDGEKIAAFLRHMTPAVVYAGVWWAAGHWPGS